MKNLAEAVISAQWQALGAHWADENGTASRQEAERYCEWAECRAEAYPRVMSQILIGAAGRAVSVVGGRGKGSGDFAAPRLSLT